MGKLKIEINGKEKVNLDFDGKITDMVYAIVTVMEENDVIREIIEASNVVYSDRRKEVKL